jgi:hypothetical protein
MYVTVEAAAPVGGGGGCACIGCAHRRRAPHCVPHMLVRGLLRDCLGVRTRGAVSHTYGCAYTRPRTMLCSKCVEQAKAESG